MARPSVCLHAALLTACISSSALAQATPDAPKGPDAAACVALSKLDLSNLLDAPTRVLAARLVDVPAPPQGAIRESPAAVLAASPIAQYCQVTGYVAPQNKFELRLPLAKDWNGKFLFSPCAGFCGSVNGSACIPSLARGYASATNNGGHDGGGTAFDGTWAANAPQLQEDYAYRSSHVVTLATKAIVARYYGKPIAHSYISSCSKGGHAVLMEIQRYPQDFDGAIAAAPVYDFTGQMTASTWFSQANSDGRGGTLLDSAAMRMVHASILALCGAQAGVDEGLVTDPASCAWRPERAACPALGATSCLTPQQVAAVTKLLTKPTDAAGHVLYPAAFVPGAETDANFWFIDPDGGAAIANTGHFGAAQQFLSHMRELTSAVVDPRRVDMGRLPVMLARARRIYDATSPDLRAFKARGGKLLMWHGLSDAAVSATASIVYHNRVTKTMGGRAQTDDFLRLFLLPGVHHCGNGPGPDRVDTITALEQWVEQGVAPDVLIAQRVRNGVVERSRPAYPYPALARYSGKGDPTRAESFVRAEGSVKR
ncbi:MAG: tannase/feruloyl esterase family alpha/beta hydrolase [Gemmatimonadota bacterium]|nr:tannase/feruloyl esterase family alpha/beta hydrolase [Gemmatimonadota bacterium]